MTCDSLQVVRATDAIVHPEWDGNIANGFDLALFMLEEPVREIMHPQLAHPDLKFDHDNRMVTLGWGEQRKIDGKQEVLKLAKLQTANLKIVGRRYCPPSIEKLLKDHMVCTYTQGLHPCKGEGGTWKPPHFASIPSFPCHCSPYAPCLCPSLVWLSFEDCFMWVGYCAVPADSFGSAVLSSFFSSKHSH